MELTISVGEQLQRLQQEIAALHATHPLAADSIAIEAVSKGQSQEKIHALLEVGHRLFAENRVQEAELHWKEVLPAYPDVRLHYIGALQSNKVRKIVALFDVIETVSSIEMAQLIDKEAARYSKVQPIMLQVNIGEEAQKEGVLPHALPALYEACSLLPHLHLCGLMCVPPASMPTAPYFAMMYQWRQRLGLRFLSMGMSGDFQEAVRFGATHLRLGTLLYGERKPLTSV